MGKVDRKVYEHSGYARATACQQGGLLCQPASIVSSSDLDMFVRQMGFYRWRYLSMIQEDAALSSIMHELVEAILLRQTQRLVGTNQSSSGSISTILEVIAEQYIRATSVAPRFQVPLIWDESAQFWLLEAK